MLHSSSGRVGEHIAGLGRVGDPGAFGDLCVELSAAPAGVTGEDPSALGRLGELLDARVRRREADATEHHHAGERRLEKLGEEHDRARLHRAADVNRLERPDDVEQLRHGLADGEVRRAVEDDPHRSVLAVDPDQHDRAREVRID